MGEVQRVSYRKEMQNESLGRRRERERSKERVSFVLYCQLVVLPLGGAVDLLSLLQWT